ncbi:MAG: tetratricopeptide repeat protein [Treponema sp.]|nr:tetratricopeptide repeat protein [Treponema sp.]MCL2272674.1 tetratricopeptide repeat protein [Treponema sp.]
MKNLLRFFLILNLLSLTLNANAQSRSTESLVEFRAGNYERAIQICRSEISENSSNLEAHVVICWSFLRLNRYEEALRYARAGRALHRFDIRIIEILGEIHYYQGLNNEALQYFQEYISLIPEGQRIEMIYYYIGEIYIRQGKFRHADIALTTAVYWVPGNAAWWVRLAYARENTGDLTSALAAYDRALSLNSQLTDAQRGIDRIRQSMGIAPTPIPVATVVSAPPAPVAAPAAPVVDTTPRPALTGSVSINVSAAPRVGDSITAIYTGNGSGTATWQWLSDDVAVAGESGSSYIVRPDDTGKPLKARVSYSNQTGNITSTATRNATILNITGTVTINITSPRAGESITATYTGNGSGTATWQWLANDNAIIGAVDSTYTVDTANVGRTLKARVTYSNQNGSITSMATRSVAKANLTGIINISNTTPQVGDIIFATYSEGNGTGASSWQWLANGRTIRGATNSAYAVTSSEVGRRISARVTYADQNNSITSNETEAVIR